MANKFLNAAFPAPRDILRRIGLCGIVTAQVTTPCWNSPRVAAATSRDRI
jgi:hypothetical protein